MLLSNRRRSCLTLTFFVCLSASCSWTRYGSDTNQTAEPRFESELPFSTREPEKYLAEVVITAGELQRINRVARSGDQRRYDFDYGQKDQLSVISGGTNARLLPYRKIYAESSGGSGATPFPDDPLTLRMIHERGHAEFEDLGTEGGLAKFSAKIAGGDSTKVLIYVDPVIGLPVKQEFYSIENGIEKLTFSMEIRNFQPELSTDLFSVPTDYRKVSGSEFQAILNGKQ